MVRTAYNQVKISSHDYAHYNNNLYWTIVIVYELKVHHCMFYDYTAPQNEYLHFGLNSHLTAN